MQRFRFTDTPSGIGTMDRRPSPARQVTHVHIHRDVAMTSNLSPVDPQSPRSGEQPEEAGFRDQGEATCTFRRDRSGVWRGEDQDGRRWLAHENGGVLYLYPDKANGERNGDEDLGLRTPPGAAREDFPPTDRRPADRRQAGDRALATLDAHGPDHIEALRSWQLELNRFYARKS